MLIEPALAHKFLSDCPPERAFWFQSGTVVRNIDELANTIEVLSERSFVYHCNAKHNDFTKWIREVVGDVHLADDLIEVFDQKKVVQVIRKRIEELSKF